MRNIYVFSTSTGHGASTTFRHLANVHAETFAGAVQHFCRDNAAAPQFLNDAPFFVVVQVVGSPAIASYNLWHKKGGFVVERVTP